MAIGELPPSRRPMAATRPNGRSARDEADLSVGVSLVRSTSGSAEGPGRGCWSSCMGVFLPAPQGMLGRLGSFSQTTGTAQCKRRSRTPFAAARTIGGPDEACSRSVHDLRMRYGSEEAVRHRSRGRAGSVRLPRPQQRARRRPSRSSRASCERTSGQVSVLGVDPAAPTRSEATGSA
jgi:hypothetical protein